MTHREIELTLEKMIDSQGMIPVLTALVLICDEKAQRVEETRQDRSISHRWTSGAKRIEKAMHGHDWPL